MDKSIIRAAVDASFPQFVGCRIIAAVGEFHNITPSRLALSTLIDENVQVDEEGIANGDEVANAIFEDLVGVLHMPNGFIGVIVESEDENFLLMLSTSLPLAPVAGAIHPQKTRFGMDDIGKYVDGLTGSIPGL